MWQRVRTSYRARMSRRHSLLGQIRRIEEARADQLRATAVIAMEEVRQTRIDDLANAGRHADERRSEQALALVRKQLGQG